MQKILILQTQLPSYRKDFFNILLKKNKNIDIHYNSLEDDNLFLKEIPCNNFKYLGPAYAFLRNKSRYLFLWQSGLIWRNINNYNLIIIEGNPRIISNYILLMLSKILRFKIVWWGQLWSGGTKIINYHFKLHLLNYCNAVLFYNIHEKYKYLKDSHNDLKLFHLNNGINANYIRNYRKNYSSERKYDFLFCGRFTEKSCISLLLQAIHLTKYKFAFIGNNSLTNHLDVSQVIIDLNIVNQVDLYDFTTDELILSQIFNNSKIFVYPGQVGLSMLHAMAYGLPLIVHDNSSKQMPEYFCFNDQNSGFTFEYNNLDSLVNRLSSSLKSKNLHSISDNNISCIENNYTYETMARNFNSMLHEMI